MFNYVVQADWGETTLPHDIGQNPTVMDPHERKSVFVKTSLIPGSDEGLFARRAFSPGEIVSYFSGQRTFPWQMFHDNITEEEEEYLRKVKSQVRGERDPRLVLPGLQQLICQKLVSKHIRHQPSH